MTAVAFEGLIWYGEAFLGVGGRLGATAFLVNSLFAWGTGVSTGIVGISGVSGWGLNSGAIGKMAVWHAVGSLATIGWWEMGKDGWSVDPVTASAGVGLVGALFLREPSAALALYGGRS